MPAMTEPRPRWWPLIAVGVLFSIALVKIWGFGEQTGQGRVTATLAAIVVGLLLGLIWLLLLSRLPWRRRFLALAGVLLIGLLCGFAFRIRGVSGNLVPQVEWRWAARGGDEVAGGAARLEGPTGDYPQFLGPDRNATVGAVALAAGWDTRTPREIWRRSIGEGWSAFAVAGRIAVTQEQRGEEELVTAYDLASGERLWEHADAGRYETTIAGVGPRATPTIEEGRVYALGALGRLNALDLATGRALWSRDLAGELALKTPEWGRPSSPLVVDGLVVTAVGGRGRALVAFDAVDGELRWQAGDDDVGYSSPTLVTLAGRRQIVIFNRASVAGHDVETGALLWSFPWSARQPNVALPVAIGEDRLLVSSGYGEGSRLLKIEARGGESFAARVVWESPRLKAKFTNVVVHDGFVYGLDDGVMVCLDPATGERCWKRGRYGHGQVILVDDLLLVQTEDGDVVLLDPNPNEPRELGRFAAFDGKTWNCPALVGRYLLLRNHREAALFELPLTAG
jgi:outer membrane protein assembly factor BamB